MTHLWQYIAVYIAALSIITLAFYAGDKRRAINKAYRIPEKVLICLCFLGGALGGIAGMYFCRHKTKKPKFIILVPLALIFNAAMLYISVKYGDSIVSGFVR